jgi:AraC-like DNA-binding protein
MHSVVPFIGEDALEKKVGLKTRIQYIVEEFFGHELKFVGAGSIHPLHLASPLEVFVPFSIGIEGVVETSLKEDILHPIQKLFPLSPHIEAKAEQLPSILKNRSEELSLGHISTAPEIVRRAIALIYRNLSVEKYSIEKMSIELGLSKSTLDRVFHEWSGKGPNALRHNIQMSEAKRLILTTEFQIKSISDAVGYSSPDSFDHSFRLFWGSSPSQMREKSRSQPQIKHVLQSMSQMINLLSQINNDLSQKD